MSWLHWFQRSNGRRQRRALGKKSPPNGCKLRLELLEDRTVPTLLTITGSVTGTFINPGPSTATVNGVGTNSFSWGDPLTTVSSLTFTGNANFSTTVEENFVFGSPQALSNLVSLGTLNYHNGETVLGTEATSVDLQITVTVSSPATIGPQSFTFTMGITTTPNTSDPIASADFISLTPPAGLTPVFHTPDGAPLTLILSGFSNPASPGGFVTNGTLFHVQEEQSSSATLQGQFQPPGEQIVNNAVTITRTDASGNPVATGGVGVRATFTPNFGLTQAQGANHAGYDHFQWYQQVTNDPHPLYSHDNPPTNTLKLLSAPYKDPPLGGYYDATNTLIQWADNLPYYWDESSAPAGVSRPSQWQTSFLLSNNISAGTSLTFFDIPEDDLLTGNQFIGLNTALVGVKSSGGFDVLYDFAWTTNYHGTGGGIITLPRNLSPNPNGTGGVGDIQMNLGPDDLSIPVREHLVADGAQNVPTPPLLTVANVQINDGSAQRSMIDSITISFSAAVTIQGDPNDAIQLFNLSTGQFVQGVTFTLSPDKTAVTLTFTGSQFIGNSLSDGRYILTVHGNKILGSQGQAVDGDGDGFSGGDHLTSFYRDFGDVLGDAIVDRFDKSVFMTAYKSTSSDSNYIWYLDYNADGVINTTDLVQLSQRLGLGNQAL